MEQLSEVVPREFLVCLLCREEYQEPKYLPCLHSFCRACIDEHIEATQDQDGVFACPVCATETALTEAGAGPHSPDTLPDNVFARRLSCPVVCGGGGGGVGGSGGVGRDNNTPKSASRACAGCGNTASAHCINCDEFLCGACAQSHLSQAETASHTTQPVDNYRDDDGDGDGKAANGRDSRSPGAPNDSLPPALPHCCSFYDALDIGSMFCVDCELAVCGECHARDHQSHRCAEMAALAQNFTNKIAEPLEELKKDKHKLRKTLGALKTRRKQLADGHYRLRESVQTRTQVLCQLIRDYETLLLMETEKRHSANLALVQAREAEIQRHVASIKAVTELTEKLLAFGSDEEKVSMRRKIGRRVRELCEEDLPTKHVDLAAVSLSEPSVTVETICDMFGELTRDLGGRKKKGMTSSQSIDLGMMSRRRARLSTSSVEDVPGELGELLEHEEEEEEEDTDMLSASNTSDILRPGVSVLAGVGHNQEEFKVMAGLSPRSAEVPDSSSSLHAHDPQHQDRSFQSSTSKQEEVPCHNLHEARREMHFPDVVARDCLKGVGVTAHGDIVVGTVSPGGTGKVFLLEKHGIVRGQIPVDRNWSIHSVAADGKVSLVMARSDNRYKVKVMSGENNQQVLVDTHIESFGLNYVTATRSGTLLATASRYATLNPVLGRSAKSGGNVTMYDKEGATVKVITNETFSSLDMYLFDRPHSIAADQHGNFFVADPGRHSVIGFTQEGEFMFEYGNTDAEEELYQGPDAICTDRLGHVIVLDKKDGRIDILDYQGQLLRCYFPSEHIRFVSPAPDKTLMLVNSEGEVKFYDYM